MIRKAGARPPQWGFIAIHIAAGDFRGARRRLGELRGLLASPAMPPPGMYAALPHSELGAAAHCAHSAVPPAAVCVLCYGTSQKDSRAHVAAAASPACRRQPGARRRQLRCANSIARCDSGYEGSGRSVGLVLTPALLVSCLVHLLQTSMTTPSCFGHHVQERVRCKLQHELAITTSAAGATLPRFKNGASEAASILHLRAHVGKRNGRLFATSVAVPSRTGSRLRASERTSQRKEV